MTTDQLPEPGAFAVSNHKAWIGRKEANLRRRLLDCGCRNLGEVFFHLWCDRLACREHADGPHDCREYKGGIEEESAPVDQVVQLPEDMAGTVGTTRVLDERHVFTLADMEAASAAVRALHAPPVDAALPLEVQERIEENSVTMRLLGEPLVDVRPWWRRMLGAQR